MGYHHTAFAVRDMDATHAFYTEVMGFTLVKAVAGPTPAGRGNWAKHLFYDTGGGGLVAFWDLHDDTIPTGWSPAVSTGLGLPDWVNHLAFDAPSIDVLETHKQRWIDKGLSVVEVDHGFCTSIYTTDPNGILVEFCCTTRPFDDADREEAERMLGDPAPALEPLPKARFYEGRSPAAEPVTVPAVT